MSGRAIAEEVLAIAEPLGEGEQIADAHFMSFLQLSEARQDPRSQGRPGDARPGDRGASSARRGLARARQPLDARPARGGLRGCGGVAGKRGRVAVLDHARARRGLGHANASLPPAPRTGPGVARNRRLSGMPSSTSPGIPCTGPCWPVSCSTSARSPSRAPSSRSWQRASSRRYIGTTRGCSGSASLPKPARGWATRPPLPSSMEQLAPFAGRHAIAHAEGSVGAVDRYLGLLASTLDRHDEAERLLLAAITFNEQMGARPWVAHCQHDLAGLLRRRGRAGDSAAADRLVRQALATARALGMALAQEIEVTQPSPDARLDAVLTETATFRREGEYWSIEFERDEFRVRDSRGMRHLARLLQAPGHEVHALELAAPPAAVVDRRSVVEPRRRDGRIRRCRTNPRRRSQGRLPGTPGRSARGARGGRGLARPRAHRAPRERTGCARP